MRLLAIVAAILLSGCGQASNGNGNGNNGWTFVTDDKSGYSIYKKCDGTTLLYEDEYHDSITAIANGCPGG